MLLLAACGGRVSDSGAEEEETAGSGGDTAMPMPTGAGSGGSYDPGTGGTGGAGTGGTIETGGSGGWDPGMPTGAGAGGSYEPEPDAGDLDGGSPTDAAFEPDVVVPEADAGLMADPCIQACAQNDPVGWNALMTTLAPCVCEEGCGVLCADSLCGDTGAAMTAECGNCALAASQDACVSTLAACLENPLCDSIVVCLLGCS